MTHPSRLLLRNLEARLYQSIEAETDAAKRTVGAVWQGFSRFGLANWIKARSDCASTSLKAAGPTLANCVMSLLLNQQHSVAIAQ